MDAIGAARKIQSAWHADELRTRISRIAKGIRMRPYAMGGAIRDTILDIPTNDWDLICRGAMDFAKHVAESTTAKYVALHDDPATARLVVSTVDADSKEVIDVVEMRSRTLRSDLRLHDLTINSLAWPIGGEPGRIVDPCGGLHDLQAGVIRVNGAGVLAEDPLRCMRAYRLASKLQFHIEPATIGWLRSHAQALDHVAGERIGYELQRLVQYSNLSRYLRQMRATGVLDAIFPQLQQTAGVHQGGHHHQDVWNHTLTVITKVEQIVGQPEEFFPSSADAVAEYVHGPQVIVRLKLAALFHDIAKPEPKTVEDDRARFIGHPSRGAEIADTALRPLCLNRNIHRNVRRLVDEHMRPMMLVNNPPDGGITGRALRRLFRDVEPDGIGVIILAAADLLACRGLASDRNRQQGKLDMLDDLIARYRDRMSEEAFEPLIDGNDLIDELGLEPGPQFSTILEEVKDAQLDDEISTGEQALQLARSIAEREGSDGG